MTSDNYIVAERIPGTFTVAKFSDFDIPDHIATVILSKRKVTFNYYHPATEKTIEKYCRLVEQFIKDNKPRTAVYFFEHEITSNYYG